MLIGAVVKPPFCLLVGMVSRTHRSLPMAHSVGCVVGFLCGLLEVLLSQPETDTLKQTQNDMYVWEGSPCLGCRAQEPGQCGLCARLYRGWAIDDKEWDPGMAQSLWAPPGKMQRRPLASYTLIRQLHKRFLQASYTLRQLHPRDQSGFGVE